MIMSFIIVGMRKVFALPVSLNANWVLRTTQIFPMRCYVAGTRFSLLLIAALPSWLLSALLTVRFRPLSQVAVHLAVLALLGITLVDLSLVGFYKVPFTCSYLPGKTNFPADLLGFPDHFPACGCRRRDRRAACACQCLRVRCDHHRFTGD
jgi:hypothetical protein